MAPIPSKTHNAGEVVRVANATKRPKKVYRVRKARLLRETNNLERLKCKLLERLYIYIYINMCTEHLVTLNGIVVKTLQCWTFVWECGNFLDILHVRFMFIEPSKWPADQDAWFTLQSKGCLSSKKLKHHTLLPMSVKYWHVSFQEVWCHEKLRKACILIEKDRNLFLKTGSNRPTVQLGHTACIKATTFARMVTTHARIGRAKLRPNVRAC